MKKSHFYVTILLSVALAALLSSCDPMGFLYMSADRIVISNNVPYLHVLEQCSAGVVCRPGKVHYYASYDYGKTWQEILSSPSLLFSSIDEPEVNVNRACVPDNAQICYRITGKEQVEITYNGGETWQVDWQLPAGRKEYMARNPSITYLLRVEPDTTPYDLGILNNQDGYSVIVAMGNQGVLAKSSQGNWERYAVLAGSDSIHSAIPLPYSAQNLADLWQSLQPEKPWIFILTSIWFVVLLSIRSKRIQTKADKGKHLAGKWSWMPFLLAAILVGYFIFLIYADSSFSRQLSPINDIVLLTLVDHPSFIWLTPIGVFLLSWTMIKIIAAPNLRTGSATAFVSVLYSLALMVGMWFPFSLWAMGILPQYDHALILAAITGGLILIWGLRNEIIRAAKRVIAIFDYFSGANRRAKPR
jgi:hypothetical protein